MDVRICKQHESCTKWSKYSKGKLTGFQSIFFPNVERYLNHDNRPNFSMSFRSSLGLFNV